MKIHNVVLVVTALLIIAYLLQPGHHPHGFNQSDYPLGFRESGLEKEGGEKCDFDGFTLDPILCQLTSLKPIETRLAARSCTLDFSGAIFHRSWNCITGSINVSVRWMFFFVTGTHNFWFYCSQFYLFVSGTEDRAISELEKNIVEMQPPNISSLKLRIWNGCLRSKKFLDVRWGENLSSLS